MGLFWLLFVVGLLNVCLGYTLAVYLGFGLPTLQQAWIALGAELAGPAASPGLASGTQLEDPSLQTAAGLEELLDTEAGGRLEVEPYEEPYDDDAAELIRPQAPETWDLSEKYVETSILRLNIAMMRSGVRATEIDTRLRASRAKADAGTIQRCLDELKTDCELYLAEQREAAERLHSRIGELGELRSLGEEIESANREQAAQIEKTLANLRHIDLRVNLGSAVERLLAEIAHLRVARHRLRDSQERAFLVIARYENRMDKIEKQLFTDPLTGLRNRIGLEAMLWEWWQQGRPKSRQMCAALLDLDAFGKINDSYGARVGDRILHRVAAFVQTLIGAADVAARFTGQRFAVMICDNGPRVATKNLELIRQSLERTAFQHEGQDIGLTACGAITEVRPDDAYDKVLERLEQAMQQAKQGGRNRSCFHDGRQVEPIESPSFGAKYQEIAV